MGVDSTPGHSPRESKKNLLHQTSNSNIGEGGKGSKSSRNPKVVVNNQKGAILHSVSRDVLNDDMREGFTADSKKDESMKEL